MTASQYGNYAYAVLTANALRAPDQVALTYCGDQSFTFGELNRSVNRRAHTLAAAGVAPGMRVGSLLHETLNVAEIYLAQSKLGSVLAALNPFWPPQTLAAVVEHSGCEAFVYDAPHDELVAELSSPTATAPSRCCGTPAASACWKACCPASGSPLC